MMISLHLIQYFPNLTRKLFSSYNPINTTGWVNEQPMEFVFNRIKNKMNNSIQISLGNPGGLFSLNFTCIIGNQVYILKLVQQFLCNFSQVHQIYLNTTVRAIDGKIFRKVSYYNCGNNFP